MRKPFAVPHTLVLLLAIIVAAQLLTYVLPKGSFQRETTAAGRLQVVPGTFEVREDVAPLPALTFLTAVPEGLAAAQEIIFFVLIVGGAFAVLRATGAVDAFIALLLLRFGSRPFWLVAGGVTLFAVGSSTIGMGEEYVPFVPMLVALALALRLDAMVGVGVLCVGYGIGFGAAAINPFTVLVAQDVAGLTPASGIGYRLALTVTLLPIGIHHVWAYARRVMADPAASLAADVMPPGQPTHSIEAITTRHWTSLAVLGAALVLMVVGLTQWHWYLVEMGAMFLGLTIVLGVLGGLSADRTAVTFCAGAAELATTGLLIGFARTIQVVLDKGGVIDTVVHGLSVPLQQLGAGPAAVGMLVFQSLTNLFIPSGSGQAYVTMPLMAPLADLVGVSRQVAVLAFQFGDGFTNILVPTNAILVGILAMAGIPYDRWLRFVWPLMLKLWLAASVALVGAVWMGYR
jgi:uncharacterized ion transporter superfamily protein YfcC